MASEFEDADRSSIPASENCQAAQRRVLSEAKVLQERLEALETCAAPRYAKIDHLQATAQQLKHRLQSASTPPPGRVPNGSRYLRPAKPPNQNQRAIVE